MNRAFDKGQREGWNTAAEWLLFGRGQYLLDKLNFQKSLRQKINVDIQMEFLLTALRKKLLFTPSEKLDEIKLQATLRTLIQQAINNEFVWLVSAQEYEYIDQLKRQIEAASNSHPVEWSSGAKLAMYMRFDEFLLGENNKKEFYNKFDSMPEWLFNIVDQVLAEFEEEQKIKNSIKAFGSIRDETSKKVAETYENFPYPRWVKLERPSPPPRKNELVKFFAPEDLSFLNDSFNVLVAGCGTGNKAIEYARGYGSKGRILAIDLSKASLAYASRKAKEHDAKNIEFMQMDLLDLVSFNQRFDIIECTGVLHHLKDPLEGGKALVSCLRKGGIAHISLYSELARREIVKIREAYNLNPDMDKDEVRGFRYNLMRNDPDAVDERIPLRWDFFDLNRCKDLFFHPMEHRFNLLEVERFLQELGLEFRGLESPGIVRSQYWTRYPSAKDSADLQAWHEFEMKHPDAFGNLYEIWSSNK